MTLRTLGLIAFAACSNSAWSFESWEHKQLGNLAYHLAATIHCEQQLNDTPICQHSVPVSNGKNRWLYDPIQNDSSNSKEKELEEISYGDIVMCVDSFLSPEKLLAGRERSLINKGKGKQQEKLAEEIDTNVNEANLLFPTSAQELDIEYKSRCKDSLLGNLEGIRAMHVNHTHFQAELLVSQRKNHLLALSMRTMEDNLFSALVMNAVSDHFLQDSFAPGHITTWRNRLTDLAANAYHDKINRDSWDVQIDPDAWAPIIRTKNVPHAKVSLAQDVLTKLQSKEFRNDRRAEAFFVMLHPDCKGNCLSALPPVSERWAAMQELVAQLEGKRGANIKLKLRGDAYLWGREHDRQRMAMLILQVRSILDVLQSSSKHKDADSETVEVVDSFRQNSWTWSYVEAERRERADTNNNWLRKINLAPSQLYAHVGPVRYDMPHTSDDMSGSEAKKYVNYRDMDTIYGVSGGADNMAFGDAQTRYLLTLEAVVAGHAKPDKSSQNWAVTAGIQPYISSNFKGAGLISRLVATWPEIETSVSIPFRMLHIKPRAGKSEWRPSLGLRLDVGFTSFLTFYLQTNWDAAAQLNGSIRSGPSLGAGVQLAAPECRALLIKAFLCN